MRWSFAATSGVMLCLIAVAVGMTPRDVTTAEVSSSSGKNESSEQAVAEIEQLGGKVERDERDPSCPVVAVEFTSDQFTDAGIKHLLAIPRLRDLDLGRHRDYRRWFRATEGAAPSSVP